LILLDTSVLVASLVGPKTHGPILERLLDRGERLHVPTVVLYEWWRGPREQEELSMQEFLFPGEAALPFGVEEAAVAAKLYRQVRKARDREIDIAVAACAITHEAALWTLNRGDFKNIPGLALANPV
jgi:predicted nucleic acid-binding protein